MFNWFENLKKKSPPNKFTMQSETTVQISDRRNVTAGARNHGYMLRDQTIRGESILKLVKTT